MQSDFLDYNAAVRFNRDTFLQNYGEEVFSFDYTYKRLNDIALLVSSKRDDQGNSRAGLVPLMMIILRQSINAFDCLTRYQIYDSWLIFRPALESMLVIGKFLDDFKNAELWRKKREIYTNRNRSPEDKKRHRRYNEEFEVKGLTPKSLPYGERFRQLLSRINDEFVHTNYDYLMRNLTLQPIDTKRFRVEIVYTGAPDTALEAHLYSFLHMYGLMVTSLGKGLAPSYSNENALNIEIESLERIWKPKVEKLIQDRPDLKDLCNIFGLWEV